MELDLDFGPPSAAEHMRNRAAYLHSELVEIFAAGAGAAGSIHVF
jgi:hypothetical protein